MIGKTHWFKYRTFGWGIAPKTWQGWVYVAVAAFLLGGTFAIAAFEPAMYWVFVTLLVVLVVDVFVIMTRLPKINDERENYHQLVIERNCSFAAIMALLGVVLYQTFRNTGSLLSQSNTIPFDSSLLVILGVMLVVKIASTIYVKAKM